LNIVAAIGFRLTAFVLDGEWLPLLAAFVKFHDISLSDDAQSQRPQTNTTFDTHFSTRLMALLMHMFMHHAPFGRETILAPGLLNMDQRALSGAEREMLQAGQWQ
jgi:hypothetical protein